MGTGLCIIPFCSTTVQGVFKHIKLVVSCLFSSISWSRRADVVESIRVTREYFADQGVQDYDTQEDLLGGLSYKDSSLNV